jgi:hypothetical protein
MAWVSSFTTEINYCVGFTAMHGTVTFKIFWLISFGSAMYFEGKKM